MLKIDSVYSLQVIVIQTRDFIKIREGLTVTRYSGITVILDITNRSRAIEYLLVQ